MLSYRKKLCSEQAVGTGNNEFPDKSQFLYEPIHKEMVDHLPSLNLSRVCDRHLVSTWLDPKNRTQTAYGNMLRVWTTSKLGLF